MIGVNVETIDFNLPVDALTEKPLFAFSCNRHVRENYRDQLLLADDDSSITVDNLSTKVGSKIKGIFDQKARYGHQQHDATAVGNIILKTHSSYTENPSRPAEAGASDVGRKIQALMTIPSRGLEEGKIYEIESVDLVTKRHMFFQSETGNPLGVINIIHAGLQWVFVDEVGPYYYLEFDGSSYFTLPIDQYLVGDIGVLVVCDPDGGGRAPVFSGVSPTHELSFDVGTAYMRFAYYNLTDKQKLFGGIDSPELKIDGYVGNYADEIRIDNVSGSTGKAVRSESIGTLNSAMIGKDSTHYFNGKLYEMVVTDFEIQKESIEQIFEDWKSYYSLT